MADLSSAIRITGRIGARTVNFSHTATQEDVYDAGSRVVESPNGGSVMESNGSSEGTNTPTFPQDGPSYLLAKNDTSAIPIGIRLDTSGGSTTALLHVMPGGVCVLMSGTLGGMFDVSGTAGDFDVAEVEAVTEEVIADIGLPGTATLLVAFTATS